MIVDLHSHTTASDGILKPTDLVKRAVENQLQMLAITDHDTVKGLPEAIYTIEKDKLPIKLICGVEISTAWKNNEIHIVGLNIDIEDPQLTALLLRQEQGRIDRAKAISNKLAKVSIENAYEQAQEYAKGDIVSRAHFARFLVAKGYVKDVNRAFKKYLGKSGYAYVPSQCCTIEHAVNAIHNAGGQAVLAHPSRYDLTLTKLKLLLSDFKQFGGDAMEVSQSRQTPTDLQLLAKLANEFGLLASQGSDFHDLVNYLDLGKTAPLPSSVTPIWHNWVL
ncbi:MULTISPECIES: RNase RNM [unclassified Gilliamella]|uniref:RNase RNM n=1 Tax=unclassified Gilliamella TaxID=2685620 RepID=UPI00226A1A93|nr:MULTISPECIES: PHP domain-containing protein [unclassified Gilliamella]MCX8641862.1 PHP domain-containing protein [Gilliamella sp. B3835]MCX8706662.1 PHP domain-containing protein [Gilliamella sp. B3783]MCX8708869.1 PHP domain-containing protein [Gilliamella sp. B3780]MCX8713653.1 PHP domain-containing protein [Gilliamella sp. B3781]MCX8715734.1 PHP domain-containing protein [Gilliamella sp. B3784]